MPQRHEAETVRLSPSELVEYRRIALECATALAAAQHYMYLSGDPHLAPAKVMHEAGQFLNFMLYGMPVEVAEQIIETRLEATQEIPPLVGPAP